MPEIESMRGAAALLVVLYHFLWWENGASAETHGLTRLLVTAALFGRFGGALFFVLSGFLVTGVLLKTKGRPGFVSRFYIRRTFRILPALFLVLAVLRLTSSVSWSFVLLAAALCANVTPLFGVALEYGPLWTLAASEQFYLLSPVFVTLLSRRGLFWFSAAICGLEPLIRWFGFHEGSGGIDGTYPWFVADGFAMGSLLAILIQRPDMTRRRLMFWAATAFGAGLVLLAIEAGFGGLSRTTALGFALRLPMICSFWTGVLALAVAVGSGPSRHWLARPTLRWMGDISYGMYLWHVMVYEATLEALRRIWPAMAKIDADALPLLVRFALAFVLTIAAAWVSRRTVERMGVELGARLSADPVPSFAKVIVGAESSA